MVIPDEPAIEGLYHPPPRATANFAYLRLHSRDASKWYGGMSDRYDYLYREPELKEIVQQWSNLPQPVEKVYAFFNNCHNGQAATNAQMLRRLLGQE